MSTDVRVMNPSDCPQQHTSPPLPDDPATLKKMIVELLEALADAQHERDGLRHRLDQLLRRLYGPKAERFDPNQPWLIAEMAVAAETLAETPAPPPASDSNGQAKRKGHGRKQLPKDLPRRRQEHTLPEAQRICPCCGEVCQKFGED